MAIEVPEHPRPAHLCALAEELDVNHRGVEIDYLAFVDVAHEVLAWLEATHVWSGRFAAQPRQSLCSELLLGLANLGRETRAFLAQRVEVAEAATDAWAKCSVATGASDRSALQRGLEDLLDAMLTPSVLWAQWADLSRVYETGACEWRRREAVVDFLACSRHVGHGDQWFRWDLAGIIRDQRSAISGARNLRDDTEFLDFSQELAGSTVDEMHELLHLRIGKPPTQGHCVVWLNFDDARLGDENFVLAGDVQYWQASAASEAVEGTDPLTDSALVELRPAEGRVAVPPKNDRVGPDSVWARVDLGHRLAEGAVEAAAEKAVLLADLASVYVGGPRWLRGGWSAVLVDGRSAGGGGFGWSARQRAEVRPFAGHMDAVGKQLTSLAEAYFSGDLNPAAGSVAKLWADVEDNEEPAQRVLAVVRMLEALVVPGGLGNRALRTHLPRIRAAEQQNDVFSGPLAHMANAIAREDVPWEDAAASKFGDALPPRWPRFYHHEIVPILPELQRRLPDHARFAPDIAHSLALMTDRSAQHADLDLLANRFRVAWARVIRYRNAVTHGSPAPSATGIAARFTADWVGSTVLDAALRGAHEGRSVPVELQRAAQFRRKPGWAS